MGQQRGFKGANVNKCLVPASHNAGFFTWAGQAPPKSCPTLNYKALLKNAGMVFLPPEVVS